MDGQDSLGQIHQNFCFAHAKSFNNRISAEFCGVIRELFLQIRQEILDKQPEYPVSVRALLCMIAVRLIRSFGYAAEQAEGLPQLAGILLAMAYIDEHLTEQVTLQQIASVAGVSPNYFSTLFKRLCHVSLWDYITAKRIEKAIGLIRSESDMTMLEIASCCGFNNTANFNKAFRKQTGMTPTCFRNTEEPLLH
jgi:AraC-like DNA-binding protein